MPDTTKRPIAESRETEWLQRLQRQAQQLTACPHSADDLAYIRFCNAMIGTGCVIPVGSTCRHLVYDTPEGAFWCVNYPRCSGNPLCCVKECARILGVDPEQTISDWVGAYCKLWENIQ